MMTLNFSRPLRSLFYFLAGFCGALMLAIVSFSAPQIAPAQSAPVLTEWQVQVPTSQFASETAATHQAPNFYQ